MPFTLSIDHHRRIIEIRLQGEVTDQQMLDVESRLRSVPELRTGYRILHDCSTVTDFRVTGKGLYALSVRTQDLTNPTAVIAPSLFIQGMARTYEVMANWNVPRVHVFTAEAEALEWLGGGL